MNEKIDNVSRNGHGLSYGLCRMFKTSCLRYSYLFYFILTCILMTASGNTIGVEKEYSEARIKAAYIYNFLGFTRWPSSIVIDINVCVYGGTKDYNSAFSSMTAIVKAGKPLGIKFVGISDKLHSLNGCQIIFITRSAKSNTRKILSYTKDSHSLTVGESDDFLEKGGMINFVRKGDKIRFEINVAAYETAELRISSKVLRIAERLIAAKHNE